MQFLKQYGIVSLGFILAGMLPTAKAITSIPTIILFVLILIFHYREIFHSKFNYQIIFFISIFFFLDIIKIFQYQQFDQEAQKAISLDILLFLFPFFIFLYPEPKKLKNFSLLGIAMISLLLEMVCLFHSIFLFLKDHNTNHFYHESLVSLSNIHPTYLSMMINFTIVIFYYFYSNQFSFFKNKNVIFTLIIWQSFFIFLLNSRLGLALALISSMIILIKIMNKKYSLIIAGFIILLFSITLYFTPKNSVKHRYQSISSFNFDTLRYYEPRVNIYTSALEIIKDSPIFGNALGHNVNLLVTHYQKIGFQWGVALRFNAHNQFLEYGIEWGYLGILIFAILLFYNLYQSKIRGNYLFGYFTLLILLYSCTESIFKTQTGITFYSFFNSLFLAEILKSNLKIQGNSS